MKLMSTKDRELNYLRAILYGDSGVGKTTSIKTLPADRTLILNAERGTVPLRELDYPVLQIEGWEDVLSARRALAGLSGTSPEAQKVIDKTKIVVVDSLSAIASICMRHIIDVDKKALTDARGKGKGDKTYEGQMCMEDWGAATYQDAGRAFRVLPATVPRYLH